jgi:hypothetical protein
MRLLLATLLAATLAFPALAQPAAERPGQIQRYIQSRVLPRLDPLCAELDPGYSRAFRIAFASWRATHRDEIDSGEELLRDASANSGHPLEADLRTIADDSVARLRAAPLSTRADECGELLDTLRALRIDVRD